MTTNLDDARWAAAIKAKAIDEATPEQLKLVESYAPNGEDAKAFEALLTQLGAEDDENPLPEEDTLIASALDAWAEGTPESAPPKRRAWTLVAVGASLAAAAVAGAVWMGRAQPAGSMESSFDRVALAAPDAPEADPEHKAPRTSARNWNLTSGAFALEQQGTAASTSIPTGVRLVAKEALCTTSTGRSACFEAGTRFVLAEDANLELVDGTVTLQTDPTAVVSTFSVQVAAAVVVSDTHATYTIETTEHGSSVRVERGTITVKRSDGRESLIVAGETWESSSTRAPRPTSNGSAKTLLERARAMRARGDRAGAAKAYERLVREHPKSSVASTSRVTLGRLYLELKQPKKALKAFARYRGSALREDAAFGRIEALRALKRTSAADKATREFMSRYPTSRYSAKLRKR